MSKDLFLVIDMQNVYAQGGEWCCPKFEQAQDNILRILSENEADNIFSKTIFTQFIAQSDAKGVWADYNSEYKGVNEDAYACQMSDSFKDYLDRYPCFSKSRYSAMSVKEVFEAVRESDCVIVSGVVAECCVLFTVTDIIDAGVQVIYLTDACAGVSDETEAAVVKALEGLCPLHVSFMTTEQYLNKC